METTALPGTRHTDLISQPCQPACRRSCTVTSTANTYTYTKHTPKHKVRTHTHKHKVCTHTHKHKVRTHTHTQAQIMHARIRTHAGTHTLFYLEAHWVRAVLFHASKGKPSQKKKERKGVVKKKRKKIEKERSAKRARVNP